VLGDAVDTESLRLAEREHGLALALMQLDLGRFTKADQGRLLALLPLLLAEFSPLRTIVEHSPNAAAPAA
jgi:hypothetical protein